ncbi:MAG TPA: hypothetical protein PKA55_10855 [Rhodoblastus sp.]|nr:hypothetical protein [Rhodoblastus sp.]
MVDEKGAAAQPGAPATGSHAPIGRFACVAMMLLFLAMAFRAAITRDIATGFDEVAHFSYVAQIQETGRFWPRLDELRLLNSRTFHFTQTPNYLNHPPIYYWLMAHIAPRFAENPAGVLLWLRFCNALLAASGVAALLALGSTLRLSRYEAYAFGVPIVFIPALAAIAGSVNNDNLAFAGGSLATLSACRLLVTRQTRWLAAALAGLVAASFAKLTGLVLVGAMLAVVLALLAWRREFRVSWLILAAVGGLIAATPYIVFYVQFGSPAPTTPGMIDLLKSTSADWRSAPRLSFPDYVGAFAVEFIRQWMPTTASRSALNDAALAIPVATVALAFAGLARSALRLARGDDDPADDLLVAGFVAIAFTLATHILFSYRNHLAYAYIPDAYPRYYFPLAAIVPLGGLSALWGLEGRGARAILIACLIFGPMAFAALAAA